MLFIPVIHSFDSFDTGCIPGTNILEDIEDYVPENPESFSAWVNLTIGEKDVEGGHLYSLVVRATGYKSKDTSDYIRFYKGELIVRSWNWAQISEYLIEVVTNCADQSWYDANEKLRKLFQWEYEGMAKSFDYLKKYD